MKPEIKEILEEIVRDQFGHEGVDSVLVDEDTDFDGEPILRVTVVFVGKAALDPVKATGLVRHMRSSLTEGRNFTFPVVAFRSLADQKRLTAAAA